MEPLTGEQVDELATRLAGALSHFDLERLVYASTGDQLYDRYVGKGLPLLATAYDLLIALEKNGTTDRLLARVYAAKAFNKQLRNHIASVMPEAVVQWGGSGLEIQQKGERVQSAPKNPFAPGLRTYVAPGLEAIVKPANGYVDLGVWLRRILAIERQVCVIEHMGAPMGTGFLVGPQAVLTNWHVVEKAANDKTVDGLSCRFDYRTLSDRAVQSGTEVKLGSEAIVGSRPYAPAEITDRPESPLPTENELDYALLYLPEPMEGRGWIPLPKSPPDLGDDAPLLIVQHPAGGPMKLAMDLDSWMGLDKSGYRFRYRTNTDNGSSGSPCFSMDWALVALHHFGDPGFRAIHPTFNQGVPAHLIRKDIEETKAGLLGS